MSNAAIRRQPGRLTRVIAGGPSWVLPTASVIVVLGVWQLLTSVGVITSPNLPPVTVVAQAVGGQLASTTFWSQLAQTLQGWGLGFLVSMAAAIPLGVLVASLPRVNRSVRLLVDFMRPIPPIAFLPIALLWLGTDITMRIFLVAFASFWTIFFQAMYGAQDVDPVARDTVRAYRVSRPRQFWQVVIPSALPYIVTGVRLAATIALVVEIATELVVGSTGLGYEINRARYLGDVPAMYALVFITGVLGLVVAAGARSFERRALHWHPSQRQEVIE